MLLSLLFLAATGHAATLWLSTKGPTSATGLSPTSWSTNHVVSFDGPGLAYGANATLGTLKVEFGFQPPQPIRELYFVNTTNRIGDPGTDFELWPGDLLLVFNVLSPTTIGGVTNVSRDDVLHFRPGPGRDYTNGVFSMLLENPIFATTTRNVHALTLAERDTMIGSTLIPRGTFLVARSDKTLDMNVYTYRPASVGRGTTTASAGTLLLTGSKLGIPTHMIQGLDLVETPVTIGGTNLKAGLLLVSVDDPGTLNPGTQNLAFQPHDILVLDVTKTEQDTSPDTVAAAAILFDGSNVGLDANNTNENLISITLVDSVSRAPFITALSANRWAAVGDNLSLSVSASGEAPLTYQWFRNGSPVDGATNAIFSLVNVQVGDSGDYTVQVGNAYGTLLSQPTTLSVSLGGAIFTVTTTNDSGAGSLRQAILDAVSVQGTKTIQFNIPNSSTGALTINLLSALPGLTNDVTIDGYTQPGASRNTRTNGNDAVIKIRLSGTAATGASGLRISNPGCAVYGLAIGNFGADGIYLFSSGNAILQGNFIGLDPDGVTVRTNTGTGVRSTAAGAVIGGPLPWQRNVISGNLGGGIQLQNSPTNVIQGNYLGTDASGTLARGNSGFAVQLTNPTSTGNLIGGERPGEGNIIAATTGTGSNGHGIYLVNVSNNRVQGNFIGTGATGLNALGNLGYGIYLTNATINNLIGGTNYSARNVIAYNARAGVHIASGTNGVLGNSIFENGGLGIDLGTVGVLANDSTDLDVGANNLQNYPVLSAATNQNGVIQIFGSLTSRTSMNYRLEFFSSPTADASGNGEGRNFLGATNLNFLAVSPLGFVFSFPSVPGGDAVVTATATDLANNTSEFSASRTITYTDLVLVDGAPQSQTVAPGANASFTVTVRGTTPIAYEWYHDGTRIPGASAATLALNNAQQSDSGIYQVVASNLYGSVTSAPAALNLLPMGTTLSVTNLNDGGVGSFRQALINANANVGSHAIRFNLTGAGPFKINVASPLPPITNPLTIDGTTQPGFTNRPVIELNGAGSTGDGLYISAGGCTIKGLGINEFPGCGIVLAVGASNVVQGNFIGTALDGSSRLANGLHGLMISNSSWNVVGGTDGLTRNIFVTARQDGIHITGTSASSNQICGNFIGMDWTGLNRVGVSGNGIVISNASWNVIGGTMAGAGNISSWHTGDGILIGGSNAAFNRVEGNLIGTDLTGTNNAGSGGNGISVWNAPSNTLGGLTLAAANVIVKSSNHGIEIGGNRAQFNVVQGNFIGTDRSGFLNLSNGRAGVVLTSVSNNTVGGLAPGAGNVIAFNGREGVLVDGGQCAVLGNSIFENNGGIGLLNGANNFPSTPALTAATNSVGATRVIGRLTSTPSTTFRIEMFASPTSVGDGKKFLGATTVATDAAGLGNFNVLLTTGSIFGQFVTTTATDPFGNTSEFSSARTIVNGPFSAEMAAAYEGFDYSTGGLAGGTGGTGWAGAWVVQGGIGGSGSISGGSLADPTGTLPRSGHHGLLIGGVTDPLAHRNLTTPLGSNGTTAWISFLLRPDSAVGGGKYSGLVLGGLAGSGVNGLLLGQSSGGYHLETFGSSGSVISGAIPAQGMTALLVVKLDFLAGADRATVYLNPTPGITGPDSTYAATFTNLDLGSFTQIVLAGSSLTQHSFDEIRIGASYEAVAPWGAPIITLQPQSQTGLASSTITLGVVAAGTTPLDYQWYFNGAVITGAVAETFVLTNAQFAHSGKYTVTVTNLFGAVTSQVALVSVAAELPGGLTHWWAGDSNALDYTGTNHGTLLNGATYREGKVGTAFAFDGTNDLVDVSSMPWLGSATGLTVMAWIHRTNVVNRFGGILGRWQLTGASNSAAAMSNTFLLATGEGTLSNRATLMLQSTNLNSYRVVGATILPTNQWVHVAATWDSADGSAAVYVNGVRDGTTNLPAGQRLQFLPGYTTKIGSWGNSALSTNQFRGGIDEVMLLDRAISSNDIQTVYASSAVGLVKAPILTQQPVSQAVVVGSNITLNVAAVGVLPLAYQWNIDGASIPDATNATLVLNNAQSTNSGNYDVVVSNPAGSTRSLSAEVRVVLDVPVITQQPANKTISEGGTAMFSVTAVGSPPLTYQWAHDGIDLPGETNVTLTLTNVAMADAGQFVVLVSNPSGGVLSQDARLTVLPVAPNITTQPMSRTVNDGTNVSFTVVATGTAPLAYKWARNGTFLAGGTNATLNLTNVGVGASGNYTVTVSNIAGSATSQAAVLTVQPIAPAITSQPVSRTVNEGTNVSFTVIATGTGPLAYRWARNATSVSGATNATLSLSNVALSASANYTVVVSNIAGSVTSVVAVLTVQAVAPKITSQPVSRTVSEGTNVSFTVAATGTAPRFYQWVYNTTNLAGATNTTLALTNVPLSVAGNYTVIVSNSAGSVTSVVAVLTVLPVAPKITTQPVSRTVLEGTNVSFTVAATGTAPLSYQWARNSTNLAGATNTALNLANVALSAAGNYTVIVSNFVGSVTSQVAVLTVMPARPTITLQPESVTVREGTNVNFTVSVSSSTPLLYQWLRNTTGLPGATNASLDLTNVVLGDGGNYKVIVGNSGGSVTSLVATLTVLAVSPTITTQPVSQTVYEGTNVTFTVAATGTAPLTYRWARNATPISNATNATLSLSNVALSASGNYTVIVSNSAGSVVSEIAVLTVLPAPPVIKTQPLSRTVNKDTDVTFLVVATGTAPLSYQWARNAVPISGETQPTLKLSKVALNAGGNFTVMVGNSVGSVTSQVAVLTVLPLPPVITKQPTSLTVNAGANVEFKVEATGTPPLSYQWARDAIAIGGATNLNLKLTNVALNASGNYTVIVGNAASFVTSQVAVLSVVPVPPTFAKQPKSLTVNQGTNATFSVKVVGTAPLSYQWTHNAAPLEGATNAFITLTNVDFADAGDYMVSVANPARFVTSQVAVLTVRAVPPTIFSHPASQTVLDGSSVRFTVGVVGTSPFAYQWARNSTPLAGATNATLNLTNVALSASGKYTVTVSNYVKKVTSKEAELTVVAVPPSITLQPVSQSVALGGTVTLSVAATGTAPLHYQWRRNGVNLPGQTSATLTLTNIQAADAGGYRAVAYNEAGAESSIEALLKFVAPPLAMTDNFSTVVASSAVSGLGQSSNTLATAEAGEPLHDGKAGGKSMWFTWRAPGGGLATFSTAGSDFDSLLAVYQGSAVNALVRLESDDDEAGYFTSAVVFNAESNEVYQIAVDGSAGASGNILLQWSLDSTTDRRPVITNQPLSQVVVLGTNVTFSVGALGTGLAYQWQFHDTAIPGATNSILVLTNVGLTNIGDYRVVVSAGTRTAKSKKARLKIKLAAEFDQDVEISDKFRDMIDAGRPLRLDPPSSPRSVAGIFGPAAASRGYTGTQIFSGVGSLKEPGEPDHCGIPGGASQWLTYVADSDGVLALNTDGSSYDTVLAVYTGSGADFASLVPVACDNNSGSNGLTSSLHFITTSGTTYFIVVDGVEGASGTCVLNYTTLGEGQAPTVTITSAPPANSGLTNGTVTVSGAAADSAGISLVQWRLTNGMGATSWTPASGTNSWTLTASNLIFGANTVEVRSMDTWANVSAVASRRFILLATLTVEINGCGTVAQGFLGTSYREPGKTIHLTATPCGNSLFAGWTNGLVTNSATLSFIMPTGLVVQANFATNPFTALLGSYSGLFCDTNALSQASAGFASLRTTTKGTYTGSLRIGARRHAFSGRLGLDGLGTNSVKRGGTNTPLRLELNLNLGDSVEWMAGRVFETNWTAELAAYRSVFNTRTNPAPYRGRYTLLLPNNGAPGTPRGDGYAAVTVGANGSARLSGALADGTVLNQGATVSREGLWPVYASLHKGKGSVWSWLVFETNSLVVGTNTVQSDLAGDWRWLRPGITNARYYPAGFTNLLMAVGSRYIAPVGSTNGALTFSNGVVALSGGNLTAPVMNDLYRAPNDKVTNQSTNKMSLSIRRSTGLFKGSVVVPETGKTLRFNGAVFQNGDFGSGFFLHTNASGPVWLGPRE